jgi:Tfp pilus assembly protein PilV
VLVALVVTVAALGIIAQGLTTGARASVLSQKETRAAMLAQQVLAGLETAEIPLNSDAAQTFEDEPDFAYETLSTPDPDNPGLNYVTVTIKWTDREQDRTYVLTRLMKDRPTASSSNP